MSVQYKRRQQSTEEEEIPEFNNIDTSNPLSNPGINKVLDEIESDLQNHQKLNKKISVDIKTIKSFEKKFLLLIESTISVGEGIKEANQTLKQLKQYSKLQTNQLLQKKVNTNLEKVNNLQKVSELQDIDSNIHIKNVEIPPKKHIVNWFCFIQTIVIIFLIFGSIGIILANGIGWMGIKIENCIYMCCMLVGLIVLAGIFNIIVFICIKKCYYKKITSQNYSRI